MTDLTSPFLVVAIAAAKGKCVRLSKNQCKKLMQDESFFSNAVNAIPDEKWDAVMGAWCDEITSLKQFAKFG